MTKFIVSTVLGFAVSSSAFAVTKTCIGEAGKPDSAGMVLEMQIEGEQLILTEMNRRTAFGGIYEVRTSTDKYTEYYLEDDGYFNFPRVDKSLLKEGTTGEVNIRFIHEGAGDAKFTCSDKQDLTK